MGIFDRLVGRPLDRDGFARRVRTSLAASGVVAERDLVYDPDSFTIRLPTLSGQSAGAGGTLNLETLYAEYMRSPREQRDGAFTAVVSMALELRDEKLSSEEARAQLRVHLRPRAFAEAYAPIRRVVAGWLDLCVCLDRPTSLRYVTQGDLDEWGLDEETAFQIGLAGLERITGAEGGFERDAHGVYRSVWHDTYDATRAALPWLIRKVPAAGGHAIGIPNRNTLLVADLADAAALLELTVQTERAADDPRRVSYRLFTLRGETLTPLASVDAPSAISATVGTLEGLDLADQYATQRDRLFSELTARGEDLFVANVKVMHNSAGGTHAPLPSAGRAFTYAVWAEYVDTLLPEVDLVAFVADVNPKSLVFPFARVREVLGELMESGAEYGFPPRYRVRRYPTSAEIAALGEPSGL